MRMEFAMYAEDGLCVRAYLFDRGDQCVVHGCALRFPRIGQWAERGFSMPRSSSVTFSFENAGDGSNNVLTRRRLGQLTLQTAERDEDRGNVALGGLQRKLGRAAASTGRDAKGAA